MQVVNKITGKDITKEINDKFIQEIIAIPIPKRRRENKSKYI